MTHGPKQPAKEVLGTDAPIYLIFEEMGQAGDVEGEISVREMDEIDEIGKMVSEISEEETPVFFTCT
jgi:hypothetical protein